MPGPRGNNYKDTLCPRRTPDEFVGPAHRRGPGVGYVRADRRPDAAAALPGAGGQPAPRHLAAGRGGYPLGRPEPAPLGGRVVGPGPLVAAPGPARHRRPDAAA